MRFDVSPSWSFNSFGLCDFASVSWNRCNWVSTSYVAKTKISDIIQLVLNFFLFIYKPLLDDNFSINSTAKIRSGNLHASGLPISTFMLRHRKYSQSECRKAVAYSTLFHLTYSSCAACTFHWLCWSLYFLCHGIAVMQRSDVLLHGIFYLLLILSCYTRNSLNISWHPFKRAA